MTQPTVEGFFDNSVRSGAPGAQLKNIGDMVVGTIVDQFLVDYTDFATKKPIVLDNGQNEQQLVVVVQTDLRGWQGVNKIPLADPNNPQSPQKDPSLDDGKRAVYVRMYHNLHAAVGKAVQEATGAVGPLQNGAQFGVKVYNLKPTDKGNPLKEHQAFYTPPAPVAASQDFFQGQPQQQAAPQPQYQAPAPAPQPQYQQPVQQAPAPQQAPAVAQDPFGAPPAPSQGFSMQEPPQPQQQAAPAAQDPWASSPSVRADEPPF